MTTTEQLAAIVERVRDATKSLSGDEFRLREIAFEKLLEHELGHHPQTNGASIDPSDPSAVSTPPLDSSYSTPTMHAEAIAQYFKIDPDEAHDLFDVSEAEPTLQLPVSQLPGPQAAAVRDIALLVCGARTALGLETGTVHIRQAADDFGKVDSNFMTYLLDFDKIGVRGKSTSKNRLVRMRVVGAEAARELAQQSVSVCSAAGRCERS